MCGDTRSLPLDRSIDRSIQVGTAESCGSIAFTIRSLRPRTNSLGLLPGRKVFSTVAYTDIYSAATESFGDRAIISAMSSVRGIEKSSRVYVTRDCRSHAFRISPNASMKKRAKTMTETQVFRACAGIVESILGPFNGGGQIYEKRRYQRCKQQGNNSRVLEVC